MLYHRSVATAVSRVRIAVKHRWRVRTMLSLKKKAPRATERKLYHNFGKLRNESIHLDQYLSQRQVSPVQYGRPAH